MATPDTETATKRPFRIRTITAFVNLNANDFEVRDNEDDGASSSLGIVSKIDTCNDILRTLETSLTGAGYEVQTVRIATNPFGEWLTQTMGISHGDDKEEEKTTQPQKKAKTTTNGGVAKDATTSIARERMNLLDSLLDAKSINFCSVGPSMHKADTLQICPIIVGTSIKFSCSADIKANDAEAARAASTCMKIISTMGDESTPIEGLPDDKSHLKGGLGNFRFCAASCVKTVPFFPGARTPANLDSSSFGVAIGLENGGFACELLKDAGTVINIKKEFDTNMRRELLPIQDISTKFVDNSNYPVEYLGIDTSLNPSLDTGGSVADAIEFLDEVLGDFGGTGSLAAAAAITTSLQSIPDIRTTGYSGLMLPVLEDRRLADLGMASNSSKDQLTIQKLLCISSVCGVGIDTVPIPGDVKEENLASLILDVAALAGRWNKPLSCRVFPVPGGKAGEETTFDSPYMCNSCVFDL